MKLSSAASDNLIDRTIVLWQPRLRRDLSREDARQILKNVSGFFSVLDEWSRANAPKPDSDNRPPQPAAPARRAMTAERIANPTPDAKLTNIRVRCRQWMKTP